MKSICPTPKSNLDVTLKAILDINVNNVIDCSIITLLHSIMNIIVMFPHFGIFTLNITSFTMGLDAIRIK
jgi:hypothetical protein